LNEGETGVLVELHIHKVMKNLPGLFCLTYLLLGAAYSAIGQNRVNVSIMALHHVDVSFPYKYTRSTESGLFFNTALNQRPSFGYSISVDYLLKKPIMFGLKYSQARSEHTIASPNTRVYTSMRLFGFSGQFGYRAVNTDKFYLQLNFGLGANLNETKNMVLGSIPIYNGGENPYEMIGIEMQSSRFSPFINPNINVVYLLTKTLGIKLSVNYIHEFLANRKFISFYAEGPHQKYYQEDLGKKINLNYYQMEFGFQVSF